MKKFLLLSLFPLLTLSCIEGPELEENIFYRPPDGKVAIIFYKNISPSEYRYNQADSLPFVDSILNVFGPNRSLGIRDLSTGEVTHTFELPTITKRDIGSRECHEYNGVGILLDQGEYQVLDYSLGSEEIVEFFRVQYYGEACDRVRVGYPR